ncbi:MAG: putative small protein [Myxococcales bacterium]|nr:putative small protein [Myxococcales bacterium]
MSKQPDAERDALELVRAALAGLRYGEIVVAVHEGEIVQIARTEKLRPPRR